MAENESGSDAANQEGLEIGIAPSPDGRKRSVTFGSDKPVVIENNDDDDQPEKNISTHSSSEYRFSSSMPSHPRKASFVDRRAKWPRSLSEVHRADHLSRLVREHRQSMINLNITDDIKEEGDVEGGDERRVSEEMHSDFIQHLKQHLGERLGGASAADALEIPSMEIRLETVSYKVPTLDDGSGKNRIPTIYNTSPLYSVQRFVRWLRTSKEDRPKDEKLVTDVLTNV